MFFPFVESFIEIDTKINGNSPKTSFPKILGGVITYVVRYRRTYVLDNRCVIVSVNYIRPKLKSI